MRGVLALALLLLSACRQEPSFDERYDAASKAVAASGAALDSELRAREQWRSAEDRASAAATEASNSKAR